MDMLPVRQLELSGPPEPEVLDYWSAVEIFRGVKS